ncbi:MAG: acetyl-CoA hydrolase/transferase family protein [Polyangiaceae bacterium]|nr:acetyl-CoA hydrolase/transferase family protein [Polyangiaceae bacterium]
MAAKKASFNHVFFGGIITMNESRIQASHLRDRIMSADRAASFIESGMTVGMSGFTGTGHPKVVPLALAERMAAARARGERLRIRVLTGASTAPEIDGALARAGGIEFRLPYQSDPILRDEINAGNVDYVDPHLSHVGQQTSAGVYGPIDVALVEATGILPDGQLIPSSSVGNNKSWIDHAQKIIVEVNHWQPMALHGMHDIYYGMALPPNRKPIPLVSPDDRIGEATFRCDSNKIVAIVETDAPDFSSPLSAPDETSKRIAAHVLDFLDREAASGRIPKQLLPLQSGVGNIANAVLAGLGESHYRNLAAYTEVIQDGILDLLDTGVLRMASATGFALSDRAMRRFHERIDFYRKRIILRPLEITNHPEIIRRLGCIAMNGLIEADIYANVNSTHVMGSRMQNGIGGSGDFTRNAYISMFLTPSTAKGNKISCIVPMVSHVDHTEHDVAVIVTEQGLADLRGLSPKERARKIIAECAHPDYRPLLTDYFERARKGSYGEHTPHLLSEALGWHRRFVEAGMMKM